MSNDQEFRRVDDYSVKGCPFDEAGTVGEEKNDKCPKCGAEKESEGFLFIYFGCKSVLEKKTGYRTQSFQCKLASTEKELAELKERHGKLVDAARKVAGVAVKITGGMGEFVGWEIDVDEMNGLKQALEREPSNETKPSERGCPFDEAMESEANNV